MEQRKLLGVSVDEQQLDFMYQAPPGYDEIQRREREELVGSRAAGMNPRDEEKKGFYDKGTIVAEHPALKGAPVVDTYAKNLGAGTN